MYVDNNTTDVPVFKESKIIKHYPLPVKGKSYSLEEIFLLDIRDIPCLRFEYRGVRGCIQNSHLTQEQLFSVPGMKESRWIYERETHEWIPIFRFDTYVNQSPITDLVDIERELDLYELNSESAWWATPKGFPRDQRF